MAAEVGGMHVFVCVRVCVMLTGLEGVGVCLKVLTLSLYAFVMFILYSVCVCMCVLAAMLEVCARVRVCVYVHAFPTVFEDADEQGFVSFTVPPVCWDLGVERLGDPDIHLAVGGETTTTSHHNTDRAQFFQLCSVCFQ